MLWDFLLKCYIFYDAYTQSYSIMLIHNHILYYYIYAVHCLFLPNCYLWVCMEWTDIDMTYIILAFMRRSEFNWSISQVLMIFLHDTLYNWVSFSKAYFIGYFLVIIWSSIHYPISFSSILFLWVNKTITNLPYFCIYIYITLLLLLYIMCHTHNNII